jgi:hypothetical protein
MRAALFGRHTIIQVAVAAAVPLLPLVRTVVLTEEILRKLVGMLL